MAASFQKVKSISFFPLRKFGKTLIGFFSNLGQKFLRIFSLGIKSVLFMHQQCLIFFKCSIPQNGNRKYSKYQVESVTNLGPCHINMVKFFLKIFPSQIFYRDLNTTLENISILWSEAATGGVISKNSALKSFTKFTGKHQCHRPAT